MTATCRACSDTGFDPRLGVSCDCAAGETYQSQIPSISIDKPIEMSFSASPPGTGVLVEQLEELELDLRRRGTARWWEQRRRLLLRIRLRGFGERPQPRGVWSCRVSP